MLAITFLTLILHAVGGVAAAAEQPRAVFEARSSRFDPVKEGTVIEREFVVRNDGNVPLRILKLNMTGGLMPAKLPTAVAPGTRASLRFRLDTSRLMGDYEGEITLFLNDPALPEVQLTVEGRVVPPVELSPMGAIFVVADRGQRKEASLEIINHESEPLRIERVENPAKRFTTRLETVEEGKRYRLTVQLGPEGTAGKQADIVSVHTTSRSRPLLRIPVNTYLRERVYTFPDRVEMGSIKLSDLRLRPSMVQQLAQTLMVYQSGGTNFQIKVTTDLPMLQVKSERGPKGDRFQNTITVVPAKLKPGEIRGDIIITTNDPSFPRLIVPVTGTIL